MAYLLARATDTLADTARIPISTRRVALETLASAIQGKGSREEVAALGDTLCAPSKIAAERRLIELMPACLEHLTRIDEADRADIRTVLAKITRRPNHRCRFVWRCRPLPRALATAADLDNYLYLIAGCVGEFWTHLCFRYVEIFLKKLRRRCWRWDGTMAPASN